MRKKTLARFEDWKSDVNVPAMLFSRVAEGEALADICKQQEIPYSLVSRWIEETPGLRAEYEIARKSWADRLAQETVRIADAVEGADEASHVTAAKLRVETRLKLAGKLDRERYGERDAGNVRVEINLGNIAAEIVALEQRLGMRPAQPVEDAVVLPPVPRETPPALTAYETVEAPI